MLSLVGVSGICCLFWFVALSLIAAPEERYDAVRKRPRYREECDERDQLARGGIALAPHLRHDAGG